MIIRPTLLKSDSSKFSIWNGVLGSQSIRKKYRTMGQVRDSSGTTPRQANISKTIEAVVS